MTEDFVHKTKSYRKLSQQTIRNAFDLFHSYMTSAQIAGERWNRGITLPDGEKKAPRTNEEFFLYYNEPDTSGYIVVVGSDNIAKLWISYGNNFNSVEVILPSREHVDNVLRIFAREEELLNISEPPKQTKLEEIIDEMKGLLTSSETPTIFFWPRTG